METTIANPADSNEEAVVINILGGRRVVTLAQAATAWTVAPVPATAPIRYSSETLQMCAHENRENGTDWRLVYIHGFSLREQRERIGTNRNHQPCFYNNDWWLREPENEWANHKPEAGYYLVDFSGRFGSTAWKKQEKKIADLSDRFERAHETIVAEAVFSIFKATGERLLENWYHWGKSLASVGVHIVVGVFGRRGLDVVYYRPGGGAHGGLRVCLFRKFNT